MTARSIRNNNPGNIRVGDPWQGLLPREQQTNEQRSESAFCVFRSPDYGFRAIAKLMLSYERMGANTPSRIIHRWAPPNENDTSAYVMVVAKALNVAPDEAIFVNDRPVMLKLCKAIATHETGSWPADWDAALEQGVTLAGIH